MQSPVSSTSVHKGYRIGLWLRKLRAHIDSDIGPVGGLDNLNSVSSMFIGPLQAFSIPLSTS